MLFPADEERMIDDIVPSGYTILPRGVEAEPVNATSIRVQWQEDSDGVAVEYYTVRCTTSEIAHKIAKSGEKGFNASDYRYIRRQVCSDGYQKIYCP